MTPRNARRIAQANSAALDRLIRANGYTPPLSEWAYNSGMVPSGPETAQEATQTGNAATATGGGNWGAQTGDFGASVHTHGLDDYTCRERLVGDCVIEREVAEAVAAEVGRIVALMERAEDEARKHVPKDRGIIEIVFGEPTRYDVEAAVYQACAKAIRSGAHNEAAR